MPDLKLEEVAILPMAKVDTEMEARIKEVHRITEGVESWSEIPADREGRDLLPKMMSELNMLGKRRDQIVELNGDQDKFVALEKVLNDPASFVDVDTKKRAYKGDFTRQFWDSAFHKRLKDGDRSVNAEFPIESIGLKATLGEDAAAAGVDTEFPVRPDRLPTIVDELFQSPNVADLIPVTTTNADSIEVVVENYTDAAIEKEEAAMADESSVAFTLVTEPVRKITVGIKATAEVLGDVGLMRGLVQNRLRQDVARREDRQLLIGNGTSPNLSGVLDRAGIGNRNWSQAAGLDDFMESIFLAGVSVRQAFLSPSAALMNIGSWAALRLVKDTTGAYLLGPPGMDIEQRLWGIRVITNENLPIHTTNTNTPVVVGAWSDAALIARNPNVAVGVTDSDDQDFLADVLTFKFSIREAFIVHRPAGFCSVTTAA